MPTLILRDFDRAIDRVHALFDGWDADGTFDDVLGDDGLHVFRLMTHEWVANLIQHAAYHEDREIRIGIEIQGDVVRCVIEDSSSGFDFARQIEEQKAILSAPAPSERGRGLLMLVTCAEDLSFKPATQGSRQRVAWSLRDPAGGNLAPLFRPVDIAANAPNSPSACDESLSVATVSQSPSPVSPSPSP
ncbi:MAG: ATP-binding protein [Bacteroidota bacterium]